MATTLIITNDFPPRVGGIESFVADVVELLDRDVVVYTSSTRGSAATDRGLDVEVVRGGSVLLPTPSATRAAVQILRRTGASRVVFGAAAPLGLMAPALRRAGAERIVALSHGHETWWAALPVARALLRRLADDADHLTTISDFTAARIAPALSTGARTRMLRLPPPIDTTVFRPTERAGTGGSWAVAPRPRVVAVGRLVRQKGFDILLQAWRLVLDTHPDGPLPILVVAGDGPRRRHLEKLASHLDLHSTVTFLGALPRAGVLEELRRADVFALPVRTRLAGLNPEGLGLAAIEASACGLPVVIGDSGGAPETVRHGETGFVVDPDDPVVLADRLCSLLADPVLARSMGAAGRRFVAARFGAAHARTTLRSALQLA